MTTTATGTDRLLAALTLTETDATVYDRAFLAQTQDCPWPKAYGGDLVAQAAAAAMRTMETDKVLHSMHSYFMRPADIGAEVRYEVELLRDGRGYATRNVRAFQNDKPIYVCMASFHAPEEGGQYTPQVELPAGFLPDQLPSSAEYLAGYAPGSPAAGSMTEQAKDYWQHGRSFDMRHVPGPLYVQVEGERIAAQAVWLKSFDPVTAVPGLNQDDTNRAALAYACDYTILEPALRALNLPWATPGLVTASLDHAMWFHNPAPVDDWILYAQEAGHIGHGRGLGLGRFYTQDGTLLATVAQEGMIREPK